MAHEDHHRSPLLPFGLANQLRTYMSKCLQSSIVFETMQFLVQHGGRDDPFANSSALNKFANKHAPCCVSAIIHMKLWVLQRTLYAFGFNRPIAANLAHVVFHRDNDLMIGRVRGSDLHMMP